MANRVLGMDCGATHSRAVIWENGVKLQTVEDLPGINMDLIKDGSLFNLWKNNFGILKSDLETAWVVAMAGLDNQSEVKGAERKLKQILTALGVKFGKLLVMSDIELVLWAGSERGVGIGLIAGTGSNCFGRNIVGTEAKTGGMSHLMADEGSGFALGWKALRLVTKMSDGRLPKTALYKSVLNLYKVETVVDLKNKLLEDGNEKAEIAKCAPLFLRYAKRNKEVAEMVKAEIMELVGMVVTVNRKLSPTRLMPIYLTGSLFKNKYYRSLFERQLGLLYSNPEVKVVRPLSGVLNFVKKF